MTSAYCDMSPTSSANQSSCSNAPVEESYSVSPSGKWVQGQTMLLLISSGKASAVPSIFEQSDLGKRSIQTNNLSHPKSSFISVLTKANKKKPPSFFPPSWALTWKAFARFSTRIHNNQPFTVNKLMVSILKLQKHQHRQLSVLLTEDGGEIFITVERHSQMTNTNVISLGVRWKPWIAPVLHLCISVEGCWQTKP